MTSGIPATEPPLALPEGIEGQLRAILDGIPTRVVLFDRERRHRYVNEEYAKFVGRPAEAILGRTLAEIHGAETFERLRPFGERALAGETVRWQGWFVYPGAGERFVQRAYVPYLGPGGAIDGYFIFARDLTDLKLGERELAERLEALRASEALSKAITASALDCVVVIDEGGRVVEFNPAAERLFGYRRADAVGRVISDLIVPPALRERHVAGLQRYLETGAATVLGRRIEIEAMRADGGTFPVELAITEVRLPERRLFTAYLRDLTDAKNAAAEIQRQRDALHQSEKLAALGSLLAGVAHELNNPLSIVIGNSGILRDEAAREARPPLAERASRIQNAAERCAKIVRTFLTMARQRPTERRHVAIASLVDDALDLIAYRLRTSGIDIVRDIPSGLPMILADADQLHQVLVNLLVNAQQALEGIAQSRRIEITARADAPQGEIEIVVADNGPGIAETIRTRIFDPFFTTKPVGVGTGIGLAVSRGIVEAHGGLLTLAAAGRGGARFVIRLPVAVADGAGETQSASPRTGPAMTMRERTALVVDDEAEVAGILAEILTKQGFRCDVASDGHQAQSLTSAHDYDAILCDLRMPTLDGVSFFAWLRANRAHLCTRIVFVTGDTLGPTTGRFLEECGRPVIEKPFAPDEVRRVVAALLVS